MRDLAKAAALLVGILLLNGCATSPEQPRSRNEWAVPPRHVPYRNEVLTAARRHSVPPALLFALIHAESNFNPRAVSHKGAIGLMQLMPATAKWIAPSVSRKELFDPALNIELGARYLQYLANRYKGDARKILIAWNAGPGRLERGQVPRETRAFVERVHSLYQHYAQAI